MTHLHQVAYCKLATRIQETTSSRTISTVSFLEEECSALVNFTATEDIDLEGSLGING